MFDLAKVIYGKAKNEVKECESLILLGEVSLENSNFKQAVEDLMTCLAKRLKALPADSGSIAETHYQQWQPSSSSRHWRSPRSELEQHQAGSASRRSTSSPQATPSASWQGTS